MWFDARAKLAEIAAQPPAPSAANTPEPSRDVADVASVAAHEPRRAAFRVADVASVATPPARKSEPAQPAPRVATVATPSAPDGDDPWRHGASVTGSPRTWTGRIVSLDAWRALTEWERHGPNGRHWNGITRRWEWPHGGGDS